MLVGVLEHYLEVLRTRKYSGSPEIVSNLILMEKSWDLHFCPCSGPNPVYSAILSTPFLTIIDTLQELGYIPLAVRELIVTSRQQSITIFMLDGVSPEQVLLSKNLS